ncbi:MAG: glycosyltransferase family 39 protein [Anaerolineae bacterium]
MLTRWRTLPVMILLLPVLLLGSLLALFRLNVTDLWLDEGISYWIARKPLLEVISYSLGRAWEHPPLYYMMLHGWMRLVGDSEFALRALSWGGMMLAASGAARLARRWFGSQVAALATLVIVTNPMVVKQARDARMYAWLMALAALSLYFLERALTRNRWRDWGLFAVVVVLGMAMHYLFSLIFFAAVLFLILQWRQLPASRWRFTLIIGIFLATGSVALLLLAGLRTNILEGLQILSTWARDPVWAWDLLREWSVGPNFRSLPLFLTLPMVLLVWGLAVTGLARAKSLAPRTILDLHWLLALLAFLPPAVGVLTMPTSTPRQTSASVPILLLAVTMGLVAVFQRTRKWGMGLVLLLLAANLGLNAQFIAADERPFADPLDYVNARARDGEPIVYTYFFDWPLDSYYNRRHLPYFNVVPERHQEVSQAVIQERAASIMATGAQSLWLMLFPGPENTDRAERAFNALAFPTDRTWFPSGRSVIRYFAPRPLTEQPGEFTWADQIRLVRWGVDSDTVSAGDALRLEFQWQRLRAIEASLLFALTLVSPDGSIWAKQVAAPCNGRCPTETWTDASVSHRLAFYIPADVPPGDYQVRIAWLTPDGAPVVGRSSRDPVGQVELLLMSVHVDPPDATAVAAPPLNQPIGVTVREGLLLRSIGFNDTTLRAGATLAISLQLVIGAPQPELEVQLYLKRDKQQITLAQPLAPAWHSSTAWTPGRALRVQPRFTVPGTLPPGAYHAELVITEPATGAVGPTIQIGTVTVEDRPRRFDLPAQGVAVDAVCDQGIRLARVEIPDLALPGSTVLVTLTWQAGGPTQRNWKVYLHVRDEEDRTIAQADGYPAGGAALTPSWAVGEVIVDVHQLFVPADLAPRQYAVRVGFYDETTLERLRCGDSDGVTLPVLLEVQP